MCIGKRNFSSLFVRPNLILVRMDSSELDLNALSVGVDCGR